MSGAVLKAGQGLLRDSVSLIMAGSATASIFAVGFFFFFFFNALPAPAHEQAHLHKASAARGSACTVLARCF